MKKTEVDVGDLNVVKTIKMTFKFPDLLTVNIDKMFGAVTTETSGSLSQEIIELFLLLYSIASVIVHHFNFLRFDYFKI